MLYRGFILEQFIEAQKCRVHHRKKKGFPKSKRDLDIETWNGPDADEV